MIPTCQFLHSAKIEIQQSSNKLRKKVYYASINIVMTLFIRLILFDTGRKAGRMKKFQELSISDAFMFAAVMGNPENSKPFLEKVLGKKIAKIIPPESEKTVKITEDGKGIRLDVYTESDNEAYDIEMQVSNVGNLSKRSRYYQGSMDINRLRQGDDYDDLRKSYIIFVCKFDLFGRGRHIYTFENRCIQDNTISLNDETVKIFLNTKGTEDDISEEVINMLEYIDNGEINDEYTKQLDEAVGKAKKNPYVELEYMSYNAAISDARREGKLEGIKQGKEEGIKALVKNLKELEIDNEIIVDRLEKTYGLSKEEASEYVK